MTKDATVVAKKVPKTYKYTRARGAPVAPATRASGPTPNCATDKSVLGVSRVVTLDPREGRHYGRGRKGYESTRAFLRPKEVVLTFDDGPNPRATMKILATLRAHCVRATFFPVGRAARAHPRMLAAVAADGHTIAGHTWSHPMPFARRSVAAAIRQIDRGYNALERTLGRPAAAIFRFPGLSDSQALLGELQKRGIMSLSIDIDSGDTRSTATTQSVINNTLRQIERRNGGVVLFHDPLRRTSRALPVILTELKKRGFKVVHIVSATDYSPSGSAPVRVAKAEPKRVRAELASENEAQLADLGRSKDAALLAPR